MWTKVPKPTDDTWTKVTHPETRVYDDTAVEFDDDEVQFDPN